MKMNIDTCGELGYSEEEIIEKLKVDSNFNFDNIKLINGQKYLQSLDETAFDMPKIMIWNEKSIYDPPLFHKKMQNIWLMPEEDSKFDIEKWLYNQCHNENEITRVTDELLLYKKFDLLNLLRYLRYIKNLANENNIVWGVGRGSSCSSFCLYLMKIHRVNSLKYDLDYTEFLRG